MRICKDNSTDPHYDPRPRRVWSRDVEVMEPWVTADEARRVIILENGTVLNGVVFIEKLNVSGESEGALSLPVNTGFSGTSVFVPDKKEDTSAPNPQEPTASPRWVENTDSKWGVSGKFSDPAKKRK